MSSCPTCQRICQPYEIGSLPNCGHRFCQICAGNIMQANARCPLCGAPSTTVMHNNTIPPSQGAFPASSSRRVPNVNTVSIISGANEIIDQCSYLNYVLDALTRKNQEIFEILSKYNEDIEQYSRLIVSQLIEAKQAMLGQIFKINEENQAYFKKTHQEISAMISKRIEVKSRVGESFQGNVSISEQDVRDFKAFEFTKFSFKFSTAKLKLDRSEVTSKVKKLIGNVDKSNWDGKELEYNKSIYQRFKEAGGSQNSPQAIPVGHPLNPSLHASTIRRK